MHRAAVSTAAAAPTSGSPFVTSDEQFVRAHRLITIDTVLSVVPTTRQTLYRWMDAGTFPKPIKLGNAKIGFREIEVIDWLNARPRALGSDGQPTRGRRRTRATA